MPRREIALAEILKQALPPEAQRRIYSVKLVERRWASVVGEELARRSEPEALAAGVLTVRVMDAAWGKIILRLSDRIVPALNRAMGMDLVRRINYTRRERLLNAPPSRVSRGYEVSELEPPESVARAAEGINDAELRFLVSRSAARYLGAQKARKRS